MFFVIGSGNARESADFKLIIDNRRNQDRKFHSRLLHKTT